MAPVVFLDAADISAAIGEPYFRGAADSDGVAPNR
ncbi:hypothetical protein Hden_2485 [Hyphomicrobium denitrificans ATCC 51888]|uniref:Uncharacterized protein n=1 Tax=Hyphomicrobium denitrificans (strain ATCC 51888 / DSM 1869 / NCIMB 11706 / TK 0415) TaxID=582899 RepID=D8JSI7_HYPDA|nr:hypothetical protein Hden_2485 [Hyphomicrobium denitrificans ATCC 51888]